MKKFITNLFKFNIVFILIVVLLSGFALFDNLDKNKSKNNNIITLQDKINYDNLDVLFVGSSYSYSSIKPSLLDEMSLRSYNLGIGAAGVEFYELVIYDYIENSKSNPKVIFINVSPMTFSSKVDDYSTYPIHRYLENPKSHFQIASKYNRYDKLITMCKKSIGKGIINILTYNFDSNIGEVTNRGYIYSDEVVNKFITQSTKHLYTPFLKEKFDDIKLSHLKNIVSKIEKKGIKVVYFELPTNTLEKYFNINYLKEYESSLKDLSKTNNLLRIDKSLFTELNYRNIDHMNDSGAEIATNEVITFLKSLN